MIPITSKVKIWGSRKIAGIVIGTIKTTGEGSINPTWLRDQIQTIRDENVKESLEAETVYIVLWNNNTTTYTDLYYESELEVQ